MRSASAAPPPKRRRFGQPRFSSWFSWRPRERGRGGGWRARRATSSGGVDLGGAALRCVARAARTSSSSRSTRRVPTASVPTAQGRRDRRLRSARAEGVLFEQAVSVAPLTLPAHSSMFTGKFPPEHGVRDNGGFFLGARPADARRSAQSTRLPHRRLHRGVRARLQVGHQPGLRHVLRRVRLSESRTCRSARSSGRPTRWSTRRCPGSTASQRPAVLRVDPPLRRARAVSTAGAVSPRYKGHPYNGEIAFADSQVARLIAEARSIGLYDRTIVIVMGDHGESLGDHGETVARVLHLQQRHARAVRHPCAVRRDATPACRRSGAIRGRDADGARPSRVAAAVRNLRRQPGAADDRHEARARARRLLGSDVPAPPLRLERSARAAIGPLQGHRRTPSRALRPGARPARERRTCYRTGKRSAIG